jgi:hypothetical protein
MVHQQRAGARILEIGNVLAHYGTTGWPAVDLREGPIKADVMRWTPERPVDLLISISTVEHIGFGKFAADTAPTTPADVMRRFRSFLAPDGQAIVTAPTAYNPALDAQLVEGALGVNKAWFMRVVNRVEWEECTRDEALEKGPRSSSGRWSGGLMNYEMVADAR